MTSHSPIDDVKTKIPIKLKIKTQTELVSPVVICLKNGKSLSFDEREEIKKLIQDGEIVYIGRAEPWTWKLSQSKWHNPHTIKKYGQADALKNYENYVREKPELNAKKIACWCKLDKYRNQEVCHGDILKRLFNELFL